MLNHLPNPALEFLLKIYNLIWTNHIYPNEWSKTIVIPIQKKDKDPHSTSSYRPICLINCICKIFEKMVNFRLTFILEKYKLLSPFQSGCRWNKSTIDNILHLENEVTHAFRLKRYTLAVILDIKSAYDSTWRRRILQKLNDWNIGSHLLRYIEFFLNNNTLQVNVNSKCLSSPFTVNNGIRQGSALSCALFNIALSDIPNSLPVNIKCNLYMDDLIIFYSQSNLSTLHNCIQHSLNNLNKWSLSSGFTFSPEKTVCMLFHRLSQSYHPPLFLGNTPLQYKESHKWLGMILDPKMNWTHHIEYLKAKMNQSINILKMLNNPNWGLSRSSLLRLYHIYCRPISDYGAIVYNSAKPNIKNKLNPIHNHVIRMITGAFRSSPLNSIHAESGIPNLEYRSAILINNYTSKIMSLPDHLICEVSTKFDTMDAKHVSNTDEELIYVGGLPTETNYDDIVIIFPDVPSIKVMKLWLTDLNLVSALFLVHKNDVPLILTYDKKKKFINIPPLVVIPISTFKHQFHLQQHPKNPVRTPPRT
ncbi:hypothetical protein M8J76_009146 [Diaphorina citri]|nr:hypothetical protein M8J76_009146 [Diaphorina citri]